MPVLLVASSQPRAGRSLIAAALAYRGVRDGKAVTLVRLAGDEGAEHDARAFAALEYILTPGNPVTASDISSLSGTVIAEAPPGGMRELLAVIGDARVLVVGDASSPAVEAPAEAMTGTVLTRVAAVEAEIVAKRAGVLAVLSEDRTLAAPSPGDIATALNARHIGGAEPEGAIDRVMIGTVASDAAAPYFGARGRTCVVTRFDKTDIQLAALNTDVACMVLTGGGDPSPYLLDRVTSAGDGATVLLTEGSTVEAMRAIEGLYATSRFAGMRKLERAVELLDAAQIAMDV